MVSGAGLTTAQVSVLSVLAESGSTSQRDIASGLGVNEPAVTEMVGRLVAAGCVSKDVDPTDARARVIALTDHGRSVLGRARQPFAEINRGLAEVLSSAEVEVLADLLDRIHTSFATEGDR
jgi:DNA-binding MarR family transcriptional regulator